MTICDLLTSQRLAVHMRFATASLRCSPELNQDERSVLQPGSVQEALMRLAFGAHVHGVDEAWRKRKVKSRSRRRNLYPGTSSSRRRQCFSRLHQQGLAAIYSTLHMV